MLCARLRYQEAHDIDVSLLALLTWVTWLRWGLSAMFFHDKVTVFLSIITEYLIGREILGNYGNNLFYITPSHTNFSTFE